MTSLFVTAALKIKHEHIDAATAVLRQLAQYSAAEKGCESYRILQSMESQNLFTTLELWSDPQSEQQHWNETHLKASLEKLQPMLLEPAIINKYRVR